MAKLNRIAGAAAVLVVTLAAASVPLKSASADNDYWGRQHRDWHGDWNHSGSRVYFNTGPGYYYTPAPTYYYPPPPYYYPPPYYVGPSFGLTIRTR